MNLHTEKWPRMAEEKKKKKITYKITRAHADLQRSVY